MLHTIAVTGAKGRVGTLLISLLQKKYIFTPLDLPDVDVTDYIVLQKKTRDHDALIHLAFSPWGETSTDTIDVSNFFMAHNIYRVAVENKLKRVIIASSIHADQYLPVNENIKRVNTLPWPSSEYGAFKVYVETLGRYYARQCGIEVVCIRLGGVNLEDRNDMPEPEYERIYLSHTDLANSIDSCLRAEKIPHHFELFYAVSNNVGKIHDTSNHVGWVPK